MKRWASLCCVVWVAFVLPTTSWSDGPADNNPDTVRQVPPPGIEVPGDQRAALEAKLKKLSMAIDQLRASKDAKTQRLLPDVIIFQRAVRDALKYGEFFHKREIPAADKLLDAGLKRADQLRAGKADWTSATGLVVRGFVSRIDGSVQPYGLVIPPSYSAKLSRGYRLDIWFHGRGERMSEAGFLTQRMQRVGNYAPDDTIVLHPYGRYSNAFKFAGEVDVLEALQSAQKRYRVDADRISVRGFSMGGAGCWQFAVHYADRWSAANPGAGFSETPEFLKFFQKQTLRPTWFEKKLWHMYDCTDWAANLYHLPTVAYSGELDIQKQAADIMAQALAGENIDLVHIIGPKTKHRIHPDSKLEIERRLNSIARRGKPLMPSTVQLVTYTLKYNRMHWVTIDELGEHWAQARVRASIVDDKAIRVKTSNIRALTLSMPAGFCPIPADVKPTIDLDGTKLAGPQPQSDRSWRAQFHFSDGHWHSGPRSQKGLRKRSNLQGPIDDALMDTFIFVRPTGKAQHEKVGKWVDAELSRAIEHWRRHFRGYAVVKNDTEVTDSDIASANLILWGDPASNALIKRIAGKLPIRWDVNQIAAGSRKVSATDHALIAIYPNPLNPKRYVVLNSSFTYRDFAYLNNARQVPMLPDWAIIDLKIPAGTVWPGKVVAADFFDERWQLRRSQRLPSGYSDPIRFQKSIEAFEAADRESPPKPGGVVFIGSSSFRMWHPTIARDLSPLTIIPRGFGGSTMQDALHYVDRVVIPYKPRAVAVYEGDNDAAQNVDPQVIADTAGAFVAAIHAKLPETRIYFLPAKPSVKRWGMWPRMKRANDLIASMCDQDKRLFYVDVAAPMFGKDGKPRSDIFKKDMLHMNEKGYALWTKTVMDVLGRVELPYEKK